jgi:hypothetical protein
MNSQALTLGQANLDLALWNAEAESIDSSDLYAWLRESGLPPEIAIRLKDLLGITEQFAGKIIHTGKIVLFKIIEFIKAHPNVSTAIALAAAISVLINTIPFLGPILSPIALVIGVAYGTVVGHRMDKVEQGYAPSNISESIIEIAREFFKLFIDIFNLVFDKNNYGTA